jgi:hypothetical protein
MRGGGARVTLPSRRQRRRQLVLEHDCVDGRVGYGIAVGRSGNGIPPERGPEPGNMVLNGVSRSGRELGSPQRVDQVVDRDDATPSKSEQRQQRLPLGAGDVDRASVRDHLERAQQPDLQRIAHRTERDVSGESRMPRRCGKAPACEARRRCRRMSGMAAATGDVAAAWQRADPAFGAHPRKELQ